MRILRENKDSLMSVLEAFIHDPLVEWENDKRKLVSRLSGIDLLSSSRQLTLSVSPANRTINGGPSRAARARTPRTRRSMRSRARRSSRSSASCAASRPATSPRISRHRPRRSPSATRSRPSSRRPRARSTSPGCTSAGAPTSEAAGRSRRSDRWRFCSLPIEAASPCPSRCDCKSADVSAAADQRRLSRAPKAGPNLGGLWGDRV
jgi:hypothetical protein